MSNYKNFIQDFPIRCGEILEDYKNHARATGREVTHMFAIAAAALPIPFERLRKPTSDTKHPSRDKEKYKSADGKFANVSNKSFLKSDLWQDAARSWVTGKVTAGEVERGPDGWSNLLLEALPEHIKTTDILEHVRNALAHGSIFTLPDAEDKIERIIFLSEDRDNGKFNGNYNALSVSPEDFTAFLIKWIQFLRSLKLPTI